MNRDNRTGRFTRIIDEVNTGFDFLLMIWKSIPLMILIFFIYKYYDLGNFSNNNNGNYMWKRRKKRK